MEEDLSEIERMKKENLRPVDLNEKLKAEVGMKKGCDKPPFNPHADPEFLKQKEYLGGGMYRKKVQRRDA